MSLLYVTADRIGLPTGGGAVTYYESEALASIGKLVKWEFDTLTPVRVDPWGYDENAVRKLEWIQAPALAHFYAGTFSKTVAALKSKGCKVVYTAAAHSIEDSKKEHEALGLAYNYPHLVNPDLWQKYLQGYKDADVLVCPSQHSCDAMRSFGCAQRIEIIPHGCSIPDSVAPYPEKFTVGYLGAVGPDKGLLYLLQAWMRLGYKDGSKLVFAGGHSTSGYFMDFVSKIVGEPYVLAGVSGEPNPSYKYPGCNIHLLGWVPAIADFYNGISLYVQPSVSEGFGIEVLEACAHARPVICSTGAGAADLVHSAWTVPPRSVEGLASKIDMAKKLNGLMDNKWMLAWQDTARQYTWDKIQAQYIKLWKELLEDNR